MQDNVKSPPVILSAAGHQGVSGTKGWDEFNNFPAPQGSPGRHGRDATYPTSGGHGGSLHVSLGYNPSKPGFIHAIGEAHLTGQFWDISGQQSLLLDCRGGNGGAGGIGEHGQTGGDGFHGRGATRLSDATVSPTSGCWPTSADADIRMEGRGKPAASKSHVPPRGYVTWVTTVC
jgi:hypothetical protein